MHYYREALELGHPLAASVSTAKGTLWRAQRACFRFLPCAARCLTRPGLHFSVSILIVDQDAPVTHQDQGVLDAA
jgi:hypothetical protein